MESDPSKAREMPILLGKSFMSTTKAIIVAHKGRLSMTILGQTAEFEVFESMKKPFVGCDCFNIRVAEDVNEPHSSLGDYITLFPCEIADNWIPLLKHDSFSYEEIINQLKKDNRVLV
ncbi:hypothetical protein AAC387_Pa06g2228 [Persea americana]